jgi:hypothetical protein
MKVTYTTNGGRLTAEFEADNQRDLFSQLGTFQEVFGNSVWQ